MHHHTENKGDIGVLKAQADLAVQGYTVLLPLTEHAPFDLVIYQDQEFKSVQVMFRSCSHNGRLEIRSHSIWNDRRGTPRVPIDKRQVDILCIYCPNTDECYYLSPARFKTSVALRVFPTKNHQVRGIKRAKDYRKVP